MNKSKNKSKKLFNHVEEKMLEIRDVYYLCVCVCVCKYVCLVQMQRNGSVPVLACLAKRHWPENIRRVWETGTDDFCYLG